MTHVFVSYIREDSSAVDRMVAALRDHGISVWLDRDELAPGVRWKSEIRKAIRDGSFFIACFSHDLQNRERSYMNEELTEALGELRERPTDRAWFIPVKLSQCKLPDRDIGAGETLADLQYVDLSQEWDSGLQRLISALGESRGQPLSKQTSTPTSRTFVPQHAVEALPPKLTNDLSELVALQGGLNRRIRALEDDLLETRSMDSRDLDAARLHRFAIDRRITALRNDPETNAAEIRRLTQMLSANSPEDRRIAARQLGEMGPASVAATSDLQDLLRDPTSHVREAAEWALREIRHNGVSPEPDSDTPDTNTTPRSRTSLEVSLESKRETSVDQRTETSEQGKRSVKRSKRWFGPFQAGKEEIHEDTTFDRRDTVQKSTVSVIRLTAFLGVLLVGIVVWFVISLSSTDGKVELIHSTLDDSLGIVDADLAMPGIQISEKRVSVDFSERTFVPPDERGKIRASPNYQTYRVVGNRAPGGSRFLVYKFSSQQPLLDIVMKSSQPHQVQYRRQGDLVGESFHHEWTLVVDLHQHSTDIPFTVDFKVTRFGAYQAENYNYVGHSILVGEQRVVTEVTLPPGLRLKDKPRLTKWRQGTERSEGEIDQRPVEISENALIDGGAGFRWVLTQPAQGWNYIATMDWEPVQE